jgi:predicted transcriptional regulator
MTKRKVSHIEQPSIYDFMEPHKNLERKDVALSNTQPNIFDFMNLNKNLEAQHPSLEKAQEAYIPYATLKKRDNKAAQKINLKLDKPKKIVLKSDNNTPKLMLTASRNSSKANINIKLADEFYEACDQNLENKAITLFTKYKHNNNIKTWMTRGKDQKATIHNMAQHGMTKLLDLMDTEYKIDDSWKKFLASEDIQYQNSLIYAINFGQLAFAKALVNYNDTISYCDLHGNSALMLLAKRKDFSKMQNRPWVKKISDKVSFNDNYKTTLKELCDANQNKKVIELLKNVKLHNTSLYFSIKDHKNPFHIVATNCNLVLLNILVNAYNNNDIKIGKTRYTNPLNSYNSKQWTPLRSLLEQSLKEFSEKCKTTLDYIMKHKGDLNASDSNRTTPFMALLKTYTHINLDAQYAILSHVIKHYGIQIKCGIKDKPHAITKRSSNKTIPELINVLIEKNSDLKQVFDQKINTQDGDIIFRQYVQNSINKLVDSPLAITYKKHTQDLLSPLKVQEIKAINQLKTSGVDTKVVNFKMKHLIIITRVDCDNSSVEKSIEALLDNTSGDSLFQQLIQLCMKHQMPFAIISNALRASGFKIEEAVEKFLAVCTNHESALNELIHNKKIKLADIVKMLAGSSSNAAKSLNQLLDNDNLLKLLNKLEALKSPHFNFLDVAKMCTGSGEKLLETMQALITTIENKQLTLNKITKAKYNAHSKIDISKIITATLIYSCSKAPERFTTLVDYLDALYERLQNIKSLNFVKIVKSLPPKARGLEVLQDLLYQPNDKERTKKDLTTKITTYLDKVSQPIKEVKADEINLDSEIIYDNNLDNHDSNEVHEVQLTGQHEL